MKLKLLKTLAGPDGVKRAGQEHEFPADEGKRLIAAGIASAVQAKPRQVKKEKGT